MYDTFQPVFSIKKAESIMILLLDIFSLEMAIHFQRKNF
ncbi:hypothetical protein D1BOALGB6SA_6159 [Olavius sp. associated proteobacterium Delta 1]|nr:hypothetical protein D1BOALGB6SA_6159 [Olavius sp. associated proteobacterium Delta 1]